MGWPFAGAGLSHLVYQPDAVDGPVSMIWSDFISDTNHTLVLPADSRDGAMFGLQFYLAEGGGLTNDAGQLALEPEALARALSQIALNRENLLQSRQMKTLDEAWQYFQTGLSDFVWMRSEFLLGQGATMAADRAYARVPGPNGPLTPLTTTWAWAITTTDPARQALAADLLLALTTPAELAQWAGAAQLLPARREAMALLAEDNSYYRFADGELERAQVLPVSESSRLMNVMGDAVFQALTTDTSPALIAEEAAAALRQ
jgi:ABC-type glycerol-3-phosphate transport system substrate-binding protein